MGFKSSYEKESSYEKDISDFQTLYLKWDPKPIEE